MKKLHLPLLILAFLSVLSYRSLLAQITIIGQMPADYPFQKILYTNAGEFELPRAYDTLLLKKQSFRLSLPAEKMRAVTIGLPQEYAPQPRQYHTFYLYPGDSIQLDFQYIPGSRELKMRAQGPNAAGYEARAAFDRQFSPPIRFLQQFYDLQPTLPNLRDTIIAKIESILLPYDSLLLRNEIDTAFHRIVSAHFREYICQSLISDLHDKRWGKFGQGLAPARRDRLAEQLIQYGKPAEDSPFRDAAYAFRRISRLRYERLRALQLEDYAELPDTMVEAGGQAYHIPAKYASTLWEPNDTLREYLLARYLHFSYSSLIGPEFDGTREPVLAYFKTQYPASRYLSAIRAERQENPARYAQLDQTPDPPPPAPHYRGWKPSIIDDAGTMTDFTFVHKGVDLNIGKYYVDIWATWCRPCLQAFAHNAPTDSLLDARGFSRLYISIDDPDRSYSQWVETIDRYRLGGRHVLAGSRLKEWLFDRFYNGAAIKLPRYLILVDGEVVHAHAAGPEDRKALAEQLDGL